MKYFFSFVLCLSATLLAAQSKLGEWRMHTAYNSADYVQAFSSTQVYVLSSGGLYAYDSEYEEVRLYDKTTGLSDNLISFIRYIPTTKCLVIVYKTGNIDLLYEDKSILNLSEYKDKDLSQDKTITNISIIGETVALCTNFGFVEVDTRLGRFGNTVIFGKITYSAQQYNNNMYIATNAGLYVCRAGANMLDQANWSRIASTVYAELKQFDGVLFMLSRAEGIKTLDTNETITNVVSGTHHVAAVYGETLLAGNHYQIYRFTDRNTYNSIIFTTQTYNVVPVADKFIAARGATGLVAEKWVLENNRYQAEEQWRTPLPEGPRRALAARMRIYDERLLVAGGGIYLDRYNNPGTIMQYSKSTWSAFQEAGIQEQTGLRYRDITDIAVMPSDTSVVYASSGGDGVYEFRAGQFVKLYSLGNSTLRSVINNSPYFVRTGGMFHDREGNLWVMNMEVDSVVNIMQPNGSWIRPFYGEIAGWSPNTTLLDSRGRVWISSMKHPGGLCCITLGTNINTEADDRVLARESFINQDGSVVTGSSEPRVFSIAEDKDGMIWVGTIKGLVLISNPSRWYDADFRFTQPKIPRNDGTGLADYLLAGERINAIAIDGGNRKWFGTAETGLYLIDSDNMTQLQHFTTDNSPLPSNNIQSIAIVGNTGEVFIGTDAGIISYQSDATEPTQSFGSDAHAYPNPVRSDYTGMVVVEGLVYNADIKIVDTAGRLVRQGISNGGLYSWDLCNTEGKRVAAGIYFVFAADEQGKEGIATKIMVIR